MANRPAIVVVIDGNEVSCMFSTENGDTYGATVECVRKSDDADLDLSARMAAAILIGGAQRTADAVIAGKFDGKDSVFEKVPANLN